MRVCNIDPLAGANLVAVLIDCHNMHSSRHTRERLTRSRRNELSSISSDIQVGLSSKTIWFTGEGGHKSKRFPTAFRRKANVADGRKRIKKTGNRQLSLLLSSLVARAQRRTPPGPHSWELSCSVRLLIHSPSLLKKCSQCPNLLSDFSEQRLAFLAGRLTSRT